jgi:ABC-type polysaccharide/polyol phosphate export permease
VLETRATGIGRHRVWYLPTNESRHPPGYQAGAVGPWRRWRERRQSSRDDTARQHRRTGRRVVDVTTVVEPLPAADAVVERPRDGGAPMLVYRVDASEAATSATFVETMREIWHARELLGQLMLRDIRIRYKQAVMGFGWALFMPLLVVMAGVLVQYAIAYVSGGTVAGATVAGVAVKAVGWSFFVGAIGFATPSLLASIGLVTKIYFPREVLPLSSVLAQGFDSGIAAIAIAVALPFMGVSLGLGALWAVPLLATLFLFTAAAGLFLSCANLFFRDVKYIVQVVLTFGIFFTPVLFLPATFGALGAKLLMLNPIAPLLEGLRLGVVENRSLLHVIETVGRDGQTILVWTPLYLLYSVACAVVGFVLSLLLFRRASGKFAEFA